MSKHHLFLNTNSDYGMWDNIEYTPPKDSVSFKNFDELFKSEILSDTDYQEDISSQLSSNVEKESSVSSKDKLIFKKKTSSVKDSFSEKGSLNKGANTMTTKSNESTYGTSGGKSLSKRSPTRSDWITLQIKSQGVLPPKKAVASMDSELFERMVFGDSIKDRTVAQLAIRLLDRTGLILDDEWKALDSVDKQVLLTYLGNIYGINVALIKEHESPNYVNKLLKIKLNVKRNEEKLNKIIKKVNSTLAKSFLKLNNIEYLTDYKLAEVLQDAYFGPMSDFGDMYFTKNIYNQRNFAVAACSHRYVSDFEVILKTTAITNILKNRFSAILADIKRTRKFILEVGDHNVVSTTKDKRPPWALSDIIEGVELCQNIIDRAKA